MCSFSLMQKSVDISFVDKKYIHRIAATITSDVIIKPNAIEIILINILLYSENFFKYVIVASGNISTVTVLYDQNKLHRECRINLTHLVF